MIPESAPSLRRIPNGGRAAPIEGAGAVSLPLLCFLVYLAVLPVTLLVPILKPLVADRYAIGPFAAHAFQSINMVGAIIAAPLVGWAADRAGGRRFIVAAAFLLNAGLLLALGWAPTYGSLMAVRFLEGAAHIAALTCLMGAGLARAHQEPKRAGGVMGALGAAIIFAVASGAGLGGALAKGGIHRVLLAAGAVGVLGAAMGLWALRRDRKDSASRGGRGLALLLRVAREEKPVLVPCLFTFAERLTVGLLVSSFPLYLGQVLGARPGRIGFLMTLMLIPFAFLCYPFGRLCRRHSKSTMVAGGSLLYGAALAALAALPGSWLPFWMIVLGVISAVNFAPSLAMVADLAGAEIRSTAMGAFNASGSLGFLLGPLIGGSIVQGAFGAGADPTAAYAYAFMTGGGISILVALLALPALVRLVRAGKTT